MKKPASGFPVLVRQCEPGNTKAAVPEQRPHGAQLLHVVIQIKLYKATY
jgi:hypothetical protein